MKIRIKLLLFLLAAPALFGVFNPALAASQAECAIWLCLPSGFGPSECHAAHRAFLHRISPPHPKPALPPFSDCAMKGTGGNGDDLSYKQGYAAYVPAQQVCTDNRMFYRNGQRSCRQMAQVPAHYVEGRSCPGWRPNGNGRQIKEMVDGKLVSVRCTTTSREIRVYQSGQQLGDTYHY